ncbi:MAG: exodeoxyribonuclease VII large subunit [Rickettsiales bacterium]|jgi:exodeoxyribonuclease VII large subunit|nr:exodeoxyribonuclease VII large subunit [Rickettsiales bacterium]
MNMIFNPFTQDEDGKLKTLSVSELSETVKNILETSLNRVRIKGEIIGLKKSSAGHFYFDLKEKIDTADYIVNAIIWKWSASSIAVDLKDGQEIIIEGKLSSYSGRSSYNIIVETVEIEGIGNLLKEVEERRKRLEIAGIFAAEHKKTIPPFPNTIGIITSETGAVIRDILHRLSDRFPVNVLLQSVSVQGETSKPEIINAIKNFDKMTVSNGRPDVVIIARGGGSLQDLMIFNDEDIVMAVYNCSIPIISAIGHETDYTLIDYVADLRAPTPTAAAEFSVPVMSDLIDRISEKKHHLKINIDFCLKNLFERIASKIAIFKTPINIINDLSIRLDEKVQFIELSIKNTLLHISEKINFCEQLLENLSFKNVLKRGYAIVWDDANNVVTNTDDFEKLSSFSVEFFDGRANVGSIKNITKNNIKSDEKASQKEIKIPQNIVAKKNKIDKNPNGQGNLF